MTSNGTAVSFDQIIQQSRDRKKAEKLATTIFGKGRRDSAPQHRENSKFPASPSLASRITKVCQSLSGSFDEVHADY